ncbi:hypothetical protein P9847_26860 [Paenibacillus chibensis]|uniref:Integrase n=1 Tax=Paenibacillus chibensis TaxID=59846 RepID=A0ABU6Q190_9BACL|nr:hypothetical protein [Paenibacillus chibensis]
MAQPSNRGLKVDLKMDKYSVKKATVFFEEHKLEFYERELEKLKESGEIKNISQFNDNQWIAAREFNYTTTIEFPFEFKHDFNNALKAFAVIRLMHIEPYTFRAELKVLIDILKITNFFSPEKFDYLEEYFILKEEFHVRSKILSVTAYFLDFYDFPYDTSEYLRFAKTTTPSNRHSVNKVRKLPDYKSILLFDLALNEEWNSRTYEDRLEYYPLYLWWNITRIIPMRPRQFLILKKDCLSTTDKNEYFITIQRTKLTKDQEELIDDDKFYSLRINKQLYDLLYSYISITEQIGDKSEYLISYKAYNLFSKSDRAKYKSNQEMMEPGQMYVLLNRFYQEVFIGKFQFDKSHSDYQFVRLGDTRHLAFCNMMIQGYNKYTMAEMGGHFSIQSQNPYYSHLPSFLESAVYSMKHALLLNRIQNPASYFEVIQGRLKNALTEREPLRRISNGTCSDEFFPNNCIDVCFNCLHFQSDYSESALNALKEEVQRLQESIVEEIEIFLEIHKLFKRDPVTEIIPPSYNEKLLSQSAVLRGKLTQRADLEAKLHTLLNEKRLGKNGEE